MSDISKCNDTACPSRSHCYRFTAPDSLVWQNFCDFQRRGRQNMSEELAAALLMIRMEDGSWLIDDEELRRAGTPKQIRAYVECDQVGDTIMMTDVQYDALRRGMAHDAGFPDPGPSNPIII